MSQVSIDGCLGEEFKVIKGLRQGCVLSLVLFSLYINSLVTELKDRECGVVCGEIMVPSLLFADDTALLAESADDMRKSLQCLQSWCEKWSVEINVEKSVVMHMRKEGLISVLINSELVTRFFHGYLLTSTWAAWWVTV